MESNRSREPWNKGKLVGQKPPRKPKDILGDQDFASERARPVRDLAMFNIALDSTLCGYDLVNLRVLDVTHGTQVFANLAAVITQEDRCGREPVVELVNRGTRHPSN